MRLAQLARKLAVKPAEITEFLAGQNITIEDSSNAKVADEYVKVVLAHFAPELMASLENQEQDEATPTEIPEPVETETAAVTDSAAMQEVERPIVDEEPSTFTEVIKPPKVELPGLKVVGKIELPEPKKKTQEEKAEVGEDVPAEEGVEANPIPIPPRPERKNRRPSRQENKPRKNPIALQREREEREALRSKIEQKKKEKELRTQRYLKKVSKAPQSIKPVRRDDMGDQYEVLEPSTSRPKTLLGKILGWFISK